MINTQKIQLILSIIAISLSLISIFVVQFQKPFFATMDMGQLINLQAAQLGQQYPDGKVPTAVMQHIIAEIKDQIKELAKDKKSTLIAKGAILSDNVPDYTDLLKESLEDQTEEGQQAKEED
jgi:hypothetical protein